MRKEISQYTGWLRQVRLLHWLNNVIQRNALLRNKSIYKALGIKRSILSSIDSRKLKENLNINDPALLDLLPPSENVSKTAFSETIANKIDQWDELGYIHLEQHFGNDVINQIIRSVEDGLKKGELHFNYTGRKIFNPQKKIASFDRVIHDETILAIMNHLFKRKPLHFQTMAFLAGSEQKAHSDFVHMTTVPLGFLMGAWIALEDIHLDSGPLTYYPGSHKLPYILNEEYGNSSNPFLLDIHANEKYEKRVQQVIDENQLEEMKFTAKAGDVLIWHANLLHGGAPIIDSGASRKSMVSHYFAKDVLCFHEISERPAIFSS